MPVFVNVPPVPMLVAMPDAGPRKRKVGAPNAASATVGLTGFPSVVMNFARLSAFVGSMNYLPNLNIRETNGGIDSVGCPRWQCATIA